MSDKTVLNDLASFHMEAIRIEILGRHAKIRLQAALVDASEGRPATAEKRLIGMIDDMREARARVDALLNRIDAFLPHKRPVESS